MAALSRSDHLLRPEARGVLPDVELHRRARRQLLGAPLEVVLADEEPTLVLCRLLVLDLLSWLDPPVLPLPVGDCPRKLLSCDPVPGQKVSLASVRIELALALAFAVFTLAFPLAFTTSAVGLADIEFAPCVLLAIKFQSCLKSGLIAVGDESNAFRFASLHVHHEFKVYDFATLTEVLAKLIFLDRPRDAANKKPVRIRI
mmetsp:Transcript_53864/g.136770  ORF Transcript_53864/g.136770 Transcript_53864/m.136770 type:complete len:201 (+) Transcript_53864:78-680(+)